MQKIKIKKLKIKGKIVKMPIAEFSIIPVGVEVGVRKYVKEALKIIEEISKSERLKYEITAMGTIIEADSLDEIFKVIKECNEAIFKMGVKRNVILIKIDDRRDKKETIESKIEGLKIQDKNSGKI